MHVYLIGYRGSGKTTIGRKLAARLGRDSVDADDLIEQAAKMSIKEIFTASGEQGFRDLEQNIVEQLASQAATMPRVVSLGGGAILRDANRQAIARSGYRIWLTASPEKLLERTRADASTQARRPALSALNDYEEVVSILAAREPLYRALAQKIVDTESLSVEQIVDEVASWLDSLKRT